MYIARFLPTFISCLSLSLPTRAGVLQRQDAVSSTADDPSTKPPLTVQPSGVGNHQGAQELDCSDSLQSDVLNNNPSDVVQTFCNQWLGLGPATQVIEYTPTVTITTSAASTTTTTMTTRVIITTTTTYTTTVTSAPIVRRAVNAQLFAESAAAEDVISSVIESGAFSATETSKGWQRLRAETGLANACSCRMVDPTDTVTTSFAAPAVTTYVGNRKLVVESIVETRSFTAFTTVVQDTFQTSVKDQNQDGIGITSRISIGTFPATSPASFPTLATSRVSTTIQDNSDLSPTSPYITSNIVTPSVSTHLSALPPSLSDGTSVTTGSLPVVTALPFSCPDANNQRVDQVAGGFRLEYLVLCDTQLITRDRIGYPIPVDDQTSCAAQCSLVNAQSGQDTCQAADFQPYTDGRSGGLCQLNGASTEYLNKPGAIAVVHTGTSENSDECGNPSAAERPANSIDTSAMVASVTAGGLTLSTPGLITQSVDGGVFQTYVSANSTDASGYVHWSWFEVSASSSFWWAVYQTSWACTYTIPRTIIQEPSVTTIINGETRTIISGTTTRTVIGGGGINPPTFVPASTTGSQGSFTTFFSIATERSTGASGMVTPTVTSLPTIDSIASASSPSFPLSPSNTNVLVPTLSSETSIDSTSTKLPSEAPFTTVSLSIAEISASGSAYTSSRSGNEGIVSPSGSSSATASTPGINPIMKWSSQEWTTLPRNSNRFTDRLPIVDNIGTSTSSDSSRSTSSMSLSFISVASNTFVSLQSVVFSSTFRPSISISQRAQNSTLAGSTATTRTTGGSGVISPRPPSNTLSRSIASTSSSINNSTVSYGDSTTGLTTFTGTHSSASTVPRLSFSTWILNVTVTSSTITASSTGDNGILTPVKSSGGTMSTSLASSSTPSLFAITSAGGPSTSKIDLQLTSSSFLGTDSISVITVSSRIQSFETSPRSIRTQPSPTSDVIPSTSIMSLSSVSTSASFNRTVSISASDGLASQWSTATTFSTGSIGVITPTPSATTIVSSLISVSNTSVVPELSTLPSFSISDRPRTGSFRVSTPFSNSTELSISSTSSSNFASSMPSQSSNSASTRGTFSISDRPRTGNYSPSVSTAGTSTNSPVISTTQSVGTFVTSDTMNLTFSYSRSLFTNSDRPRTGAYSGSSVSSSLSRLSSTPSSPVISTSTLVPFTLSDRPRTGSYLISTSLNFTSTSTIPSFSSSNTIVFTSTITPSAPIVVSSSGFPTTISSNAPTSSSVAFSAHTLSTITPSSSPTIIVSSIKPLLNSTVSSSVVPSWTSSLSVVSVSSATSSGLVASFSYPSSLFSLIVSPSISTPDISTTPPFLSSSSFVSTSIPSTTQPSTQSVTSVNTSSASEFILSMTSIVPTSISVSSLSGTKPVTAYETTSVSIIRTSTNGTISISTVTPPTSSITVAIPGNSTTNFLTQVTSIVPPSYQNSSTPTGNEFTTNSIANTRSTRNSSITSMISSGSGVVLTTPTLSVSINITSTPFRNQNSTVTLPTRSTNTTLIPSTTPSPSSNLSTSQMCPTSPVTITQVSIVTSVSIQLVTTTLTQTVLNLPTSSPMASLSVSSATPIDPRDLEARFRNASQPATQEQIDATCADSRNIVLNPSFAQAPGSSEAARWTQSNSDPTMNVNFVVSSTGNGTLARFTSAVPGRSLSLRQPLTLCPGITYRVTALTRQDVIYAGCTVQFAIGSQTLFTASPAVTWTQGRAQYTVGEGTEGASQDFMVTASCAGYGGLPVGDWMAVEVAGLTVESGI